ncbi:PBP1A family penicillin-binding protein [Ornithinibacillus sp. L9]|uniref:PBP1A family penicillin-binding protein n=1 Tax=Ornithinibacillus caprae TaxID=2678566 RepID=A0A6N8FQZ7_9BACI|nr:transglycosylase domain-containing protein [Ornithinibacillus caprae]MUK90098.1 PBP1A family penicillin-binding protein [Ornithinibacillus caprae]
MNKFFKNKFGMIPPIVKIPLSVFMIILLLSLIGYAFILYGGKLVVNEENLILDASTTIETKDGEIIGTLYDEHRDPIEIEDIPDHVLEAFIAIEDKRFYQHGGVDFRSVVRAVYRDIVAMNKVEGASTVTQQVAKNLFLYNDKTWMRKTKEVMASIYLERNFSKSRILELYVNSIYFGHGMYGIEAASQHYFSKPASDLTVSEGALLAGMVKAPNGYSPIDHPDKALERRNVVLKAMENANMLSTEERLTEQGKTLGLNIQEKKARPWLDSYIDLVLKEAVETHQLSIEELKRGGYRIVVNIDESTQQLAYEQFQNEQYFPGNTKDVEGAFVMMKHSTGEIVAAVGGRKYTLGDLNRVTVNRQPGSTIKPIAVYGPALMQEAYQPYTLIPDELNDYDGYTATNIDGKYEGIVSIYQAILHSKNASAVWLLDQIGISYAKNYLDKMDISIPDDGLALALGGLTEGISPLQMMEAYSTFINDGKVVGSSTINRIYDREDELLYQMKKQETEVFSPQVAWDITEILSTTVQDGTAKAGNFNKALAGKTGTTEHPHANGNKDVWFVGYTPEYVSATWMGYDRSDENHYLTGGSSYPTELTKKILSEMDKRNTLSGEFDKPDHVKELPKPIILPQIADLNAEYTFGGISLVKGKLTWNGSDDDRVIYRIYQEKPGIDERVGEVTGESEYVIDKLNLFQSSHFYVVPYDPLTKMEGERSDKVELAFKWQQRIGGL